MSLVDCYSEVKGLFCFGFCLFWVFSLLLLLLLLYLTIMPRGFKSKRKVVEIKRLVFSRTQQERFKDGSLEGCWDKPGSCLQSKHDSFFFLFVACP